MGLNWARSTDLRRMDPRVLAGEGIVRSIRETSIPVDCGMRDRVFADRRKVGREFFCSYPYQWFVHDVAPAIENFVADHVVSEGFRKSIPSEVRTILAACPSVEQNNRAGIRRRPVLPLGLPQRISHVLCTHRWRYAKSKAK